MFQTPEVKLDWLALLEPVLEDVSFEDCEPGTEVEEGEEVIGRMSDELKKFFVLRTEKIKSAELMKLNFVMSPLMLADTTVVKEEDARKALKEAEILNDIFWTCVNDMVDSWGFNIGIRRGWVIVKMAEKKVVGEETPDNPSFAEFLQMLSAGIASREASDSGNGGVEKGN